MCKWDTKFWDMKKESVTRVITVLKMDFTLKWNPKQVEPVNAYTALL